MTDKHSIIITVLCIAGVSCSLLKSFAAPAHKSNWAVPGARPVSGIDLQYSDDPVIPSRVVSLRSKESVFDGWGDLSVYPVVRAPDGELFYGFVRNYAAGTFGDRWVRWTFPTQFRSKDTQVTDEKSASYGDALEDDFDFSSGKHLPYGRYDVKWVVNSRLLTTGDSFVYASIR